MVRAAASTNYSNCNCFAVRSAARHITQFYDQYLAETGLRSTQFTILANLRELGPMTINVLAREMVMDRTTLGRNIVPLQRDDLIAVKADAKDGRAKELHLTKAGKTVLLKAADNWSKAQSAFEASLGPNRADSFRTMLRLVVTTSFDSSR
jgi:DNA-binding MarR family transcriptional regulator